jgi:hypothetical protein
VKLKIIAVPEILMRDGKNKEVKKILPSLYDFDYLGTKTEKNYLE